MAWTPKTPKDYWDGFVQSTVEFFRGIPEDDWNDYERLQKDYWWNPFAKKRMDELAYEENQDWWSDYDRNTGTNHKNNPYPIRNGVYGHYVSPLDYFEVTDAIIDLYRR